MDIVTILAVNLFGHFVENLTSVFAATTEVKASFLQIIPVTG
ncbi:hypothetical protein [Sulfurirhabdus autotrophica]|nr:hypothetical protein [Sulfurirhabdus autotrophica]